jgi:hypothetical protein
MYVHYGSRAAAGFSKPRYQRLESLFLPVPCVAVKSRLRGLGAPLSQQNESIAQAASAGASATAAILVAMGTIGGPVGAIIAGIAGLGVAIANAFAGCGQTCVEATSIANQVEPILDQNLQTYMSAPVHYASLQAAAVNNFNTAWSSLVSACSNPQLAAAGQHCVSDRQSGACTWKASPGGWTQGSDGAWTYTPWGAAGSGTACWNWFVGYLDPIQNDPTVVPDPVAPGSTVSAGLLSDVGINANTTIAGIPISDLLLPAAIVLAAVLLL